MNHEPMPAEMNAKFAADVIYYMATYLGVDAYALEQALQEIAARKERNQ